MMTWCHATIRPSLGLVIGTVQSHASFAAGHITHYRHACAAATTRAAAERAPALADLHTPYLERLAAPGLVTEDIHSRRSTNPHATTSKWWNTKLE